MRHKYSIRDAQVCIIGLFINEDIKLRTKKRLKKGYIYIYSIKAPAKPLIRVYSSSITSVLSFITVPFIPVL